MFALVAVAFIIVIIIIMCHMHGMKVKDESRELWSDHIRWTREYLALVASGLGHDRTAVTTRLMKNQEDIGKWFGRYYSDDKGEKITALLKEHINLIAQIADGAQSQLPALQANADAIVKLIAPGDEKMKHHMQSHLDLTLQMFNEMQAKAAANYATYDKVQSAALAMADDIASKAPCGLF